jgi:hypothetical protein
MAAVLDETRDVILAMPRTTPLLTPVIMTIPLQLLAYTLRSTRLRRRSAAQPRASRSRWNSEYKTPVRRTLPKADLSAEPEA